MANGLLDVMVGANLRFEPLRTEHHEQKHEGADRQVTARLGGTISPRGSTELARHAAVTAPVVAITGP